MKEFEIGTIYKLNKELFSAFMIFDRDWEGHDSDIPDYVCIKKETKENLFFDEYSEGFRNWGYKTDLRISKRTFKELLTKYSIIIHESNMINVFGDAITSLAKNIIKFGYPPTIQLRAIEELDKEIDSTGMFEELISDMKKYIKPSKYNLNEWDYFIRLFGENDIDMDDYTVKKAKILLS